MICAYDKVYLDKARVVLARMMDFAVYDLHYKLRDFFDGCPYCKTYYNIDYVEKDDIIKTTKKLDSFMDWNLLNINNYSRVRKVLGLDMEEVTNEQN